MKLLQYESPAATCRYNRRAAASLWIGGGVAIAFPAAFLVTEWFRGGGHLSPNAQVSLMGLAWAAGLAASVFGCALATASVGRATRRRLALAGAALNATLSLGLVWLFYEASKWG